METEKLVPYDEDADVNYETACFGMGLVISIYNTWWFVETLKENPDEKYMADLQEKELLIERERQSLDPEDRERVNLAIEKYSALAKELRADERYEENAQLAEECLEPNR